jgi:hypothetical protein
LTCAKSKKWDRASSRWMGGCTVKEIKAKLQWNSCSNNSNSTWWWPNVAETCSTRVKTNVLEVALKTVILSIKVYIWMQQDAEI